MPHKTWLAVFFGYNGTPFHGMQHQRQQNIHSIQKELITTLHSHSLLPHKIYNQLVRNYKFGRAARTDKGVHAVMNGISCLFTIDNKFFNQEDKMLKKMELFREIREIFQPKGIIVHGIRRVCARFDIRQMVKARVYCYVCPMEFFMNVQEKNKTDQKMQQQQNLNGMQHNKNENKEDQEEILKKINQCCKKFIGTHNFHNYSKNLKAKDPKARRYILQFKCQKLDITQSINEKDNEKDKKIKKWLKFTIKGQSFVYHQIRKIIGSIVQVFVSKYEPQFIGNTFFNNQFYVPLAPPFGLYLHSLSFESYNRKNQIPEKIQFDDKGERQSMQKMEQAIIEHVLSVQPEKWREWLSLVLEGVVPKFEEDEEEDGDVDDG